MPAGGVRDPFSSLAGVAHPASRSKAENRMTRRRMIGLSLKSSVRLSSYSPGPPGADHPVSFFCTTGRLRSPDCRSSRIPARQPCRRLLARHSAPAATGGFFCTGGSQRAQVIGGFQTTYPCELVKGVELARRAGHVEVEALRLVNPFLPATGRLDQPARFNAKCRGISSVLMSCGIRSMGARSPSKYRQVGQHHRIPQPQPLEILHQNSLTTVNSPDRLDLTNRSCRSARSSRSTDDAGQWSRSGQWQGSWNCAC